MFKFVFSFESAFLILAPRGCICKSYPPTCHLPCYHLASEPAYHWIALEWNASSMSEHIAWQSMDTMQNTVQHCIKYQCTTLYISAKVLYISAKYCATVHCINYQCTMLYTSANYCALCRHYLLLHVSALHCTDLYCSVLHYSANTRIFSLDSKSILSCIQHILALWI